MCWKMFWRCGVFSGSFLILLEQRFCRTLVNFVYLNLLFLYFQGKKKFPYSIWSVWWFWLFYFDLVSPLYFLKWNRCFAAFVPVLTSLIKLLITMGGMHWFTVSKFAQREFWETVLVQRGSRFWGNNIEKHLTNKYWFFSNWFYWDSPLNSLMILI